MRHQQASVVAERANDIRKKTLEMIGRLGVGHVGGSMSIVEAVSVLYFDEMNINPADPKWQDRDRFVLSKGHAGPTLYAALAYRGYFDVEELTSLNQPGTNLPSHCDMIRTTGIDMTAGSLGQGLPAAVGMAIAAKIDNNPGHIYSLIGDGESQEGLIWEAAMLAGSRKLSNLTAMIDYNKMQLDGTVADVNTIEPLGDKWRAFGWNVLEADGHDIEAISDAFEKARAEKTKPTMIILHTIKAKGASFAEGMLSSHNMNVTEEQWKEAVKQLG